MRDSQIFEHHLTINKKVVLTDKDGSVRGIDVLQLVVAVSSTGVVSWPVEIGASIKVEIATIKVVWPTVVVVIVVVVIIVVVIIVIVVPF